MCMDGRAINKITVKYRFLIPRLNNLLDIMAIYQIFSSIDLHNGYYQICICKDVECKAAFKIKDGLHEWDGHALWIVLHAKDIYVNYDSDASSFLS